MTLPKSSQSAQRPWKRRPLSPRSPLEGRQLWRVGDWGGASEQIGRRWEELGAPELQKLLGVQRTGPDGASYLPSQAIVLAAEPGLAAQVQLHGKTHADALLVGTMAGRAVLEPVDFKWTLETADPRQVGAAVLEALLDDPPSMLAEAIERALAALDPSSCDYEGDPPSVPPAGRGEGRGQPMYHDGIFLAPDSAPNRAYLAPRGPLDTAWAALVPVDAAEFFPSLPGWDVAEALAEIDRAHLGRLEMAERYYRLGAGVRGALRKLEAGIFAESLPELDDVAELQRLLRQRRLRAVGEVVAHFDRALTARSERLEQLRKVERAAYPWGQYQADLKARNIRPRRGERRWNAIYGGIMKRIAPEVRAAGRSLISAGASEADALAQLGKQQAHFTAMARQMLGTAMSEELGMKS